jgi:D-beta-D-heptose 7-phosphate kinase / D-beta-D-heptose 1-phosphate adenosyltransferase
MWLPPIGSKRLYFFYQAPRNLYSVFNSRDGGKLKGHADLLVLVPSVDIARVQETLNFCTSLLDRVHRILSPLRGIMKNSFQIPDFSGVKVLVIGDLILDQYIWGKVDRISPEAPIPVVKVESRSFRLGGAANVAANLTGLGCKVFLVGVHGTDPSGRILQNILKEKKLDGSCVFCEAVPTITKIRVVGGHQQLLRIDEEKTDGFPDWVYIDLKRKITEHMPDVDVVIMSDYGKGMFLKGLAADCIKEDGRFEKPIFVDPKMQDWNLYRGATCITPNLKEFNEVSIKMGLEKKTFFEKGFEICRQFDLTFLLVTQGSQGMSLFHGDGYTATMPTTAREVYDVSGAGDTVIASFAASFAAGLPLDKAMKLSNLAAGVAVGKVGTHAITLDELNDAVRFSGTTFSKCVSTLQEGLEIIDGWRRRGEKIVFTNGCFDLLHAGHIKLLRAARQEGSKLIVGLNTDESIRRLKGDSRPIVNQYDRAVVISALDCVDLVVFFDDDTPLQLIQKLRPNILCKGSDYTRETVVGHELVESWGGRIVLIPLVTDLSTSKILERIQRGYLKRSS